jgi:hypothetical protein
MVFTFPHRSAAAWMDVMSRSTWPVEVVQAMDADSYSELLDHAEAGQFVPDDIVALARAALAEAGGRPWWQVQRLCNVATAGDGRLLGALVLGGASPERLSLAAFCSAVWAKLTEHADAVGMMKAEAELAVPPPEVTAAELEAADQASMTDLVQAARSMPGVRTG